MTNSSGSMSEEGFSLDVQKQNPIKESSSRLHRQASADAAFLRNLSMKKEREEAVSPFSYTRSRSACHPDYAEYRQKYLIMYSPFRMEEESVTVKEKTKKWLKKNLLKEASKTESKQNSATLSKDKPPTSFHPCPLAESVVRFFRLRRGGANFDARRVRKSSAVTPVS